RNATVTIEHAVEVGTTGRNTDRAEQHRVLLIREVSVDQVHMVAANYRGVRYIRHTTLAHVHLGVAAVYHDANRHQVFLYGFHTVRGRDQVALDLHTRSLARRYLEMISLQPGLVVVRGGLGCQQHYLVSV